MAALIPGSYNIELSAGILHHDFRLLDNKLNT
jgi:hypothetical protein